MATAPATAGERRFRQLFAHLCPVDAAYRQIEEEPAEGEPERNEEARVLDDGEER